MIITQFYVVITLYHGVYYVTLLFRILSDNILRIISISNECLSFRYAILPHKLLSKKFILASYLVMRLSWYQWRDSNGSFNINYAHKIVKIDFLLIFFNSPHLQWNIFRKRYKNVFS